MKRLAALVIALAVGVAGWFLADQIHNSCGAGAGCVAFIPTGDPEEPKIEWRHLYAGAGFVGAWIFFLNVLWPRRS